MDFNQLGTQMLNWIGWHPMISILLEELSEDTNVRQIIHPKNIQNDEQTRSTNMNKDSQHDFSNQFQIQKEIVKDSNPIIILIKWTDFWIKGVQNISLEPTVIYRNNNFSLENAIKNGLFLWEKDNFNGFSGFLILVGIIIDPMSVISFLLCLNN